MCVCVCVVSAQGCDMFSLILNPKHNILNPNANSINLSNLSIYISTYLSIYLSIYPSIYLSIHILNFSLMTIIRAFT